MIFLFPASGFANGYDYSPEICWDKSAFSNHKDKQSAALFSAPPVDATFTCTGNAVFAAYQTGVDNTVNALGTSDDLFAQLYETNDTLTLKLEDEVVSGSAVVIRWRKLGTSNPSIAIAQSSNNSTWTTHSTQTVNSSTYVNLSITLTANTRYLRFRNTTNNDLQLDAVTYTSQTCNYTSGEGVPLSCSATTTSIAGTVFHDFDGDGVYDSGSDYLGIQNINVTAVDSLGNSFSATTSSAGAYSITGLVAGRTYRVEFNIPTTLSWLYSSFRGTNNGTTVQFIRPNNCANLGLISPTDYCKGIPDLILPCYENGSGVGNTNPAVVTLPYNGVGITPAESSDFQTQVVGSVYGAAYDRRNKRVFVSSFLKRHSGFGPRGVDGVYVLDYSTTTPSLLGGFDLQGVTPANGGPNIDLGSINRTNIGDVNISSGAAGDYQLSSNRTRPSVDLDAFGKVGTISYGDIDMSEDGRTLWLVNLKQKALISVDISNLGTLSNPTNTLPSASVKQYLLSSLTGVPTCTGDTLRPFALEFYKGKGYVGCVCDAYSSSTLKKPATLDGYILSFDPANPTTLTTEVTFGFDYNREKSYSQLNPASGSVAGEWQRWTNTYNTGNVNTGFANFQSSPQPLIADIEIVDNGDMVVGVMDRFAHQQGWEQYRAMTGDRTNVSGLSTGDILKFGLSGGSYVAEFGENDTKSSPAGFINTDSPGNGGEFFYGDYYTGWDASHCETALGGLTIMPGTNEVTVGSLDPLAFNSQGVTWMSLSTGAQNRIYQVTGNTNIANFGKGAALGDFEMMCDASPIEIGNYVWLDTDKDGVQDPGEAGLNGVKVNLYQLVSGTATLKATTTTATVNGLAGAYYFRDHQQYGTGFDTLSLNTQYYIALGETGGTYNWSTANQNLPVGGTNYVLTTMNTGSGTTPDQNDSDAFVFTTAGKPYTNYPVDTVTIGNAGYVNHTLDFGLKVCPTITNPSAAQTICAGGSGSNITVNTSTNAASSIRFVRFTTDQMAGSTPTTAEAAAIYAGTVISTVTPTGGASPYTATYTFNASDFPSSSSTYYVYAILNPDEGAACRPTQEIVVNVNNVTGSTVGSDQTICSGGNPAAFTVSSAATGSGTLTYQWQSSTTSCSAGFSNIALATSATYDAPSGLTQTTYYRVVVTSTLNSVACTATSNCVTVTVNSLSGSIGSNQTICSGGNPAAFTNSYTGSGTLSYQWQSSTTNCSSGFTNISGATSATYDPPSGLTQTTYYKVVVTSTLNSVACTSTSNCATVTVNNVSASTVSGDQTICPSGDPTAFSVTAAATGTGTLTYQWQKSTTSCSADFINISGATSATYNPPAGLTQTTYYRVVATSTVSGVGCSATSNCITVTALPFCETYCANNVITNASFDNPSLPGSGTFSFAGGTAVNLGTAAPTGFSKATTNGDNYWVQSSKARTGNKYIYMYSSGTTPGSSDACTQFTKSSLSGSTTYNLCIFAADAKADGFGSGMSLEVQENNGGPFHWLNFLLPNNPAWSDASATDVPWTQYCYTFTTAAATTSLTMWLSASAEQGGTTAYIVVDDICLEPTTIAQQPTIGGSSSTAATCTGGTANNNASITLTGITNGTKADKVAGASYTGGPAYGAGTNVTVSGGNAIFTGLAHNTQYTFRVWNSKCDCYQDITLTTPITCCVAASTVGSNQTICPGGDPAAFTVISAATGSGTLSYQWQSSTTNCAAGFADISGATSSTYDPPSGLTQTTYYRVIVTNTVGASTCTATSNCVTVTVQPLISGMSANVGACDPSDNTYNLTLTVSFSSTPSGNINIRYGDITRSFATTSALSQNFVFTNLYSNGTQDIDVSASMASTPTCTYSAADLVDAPARCAPDCCVSNVFTNGNLENGTWTGASTFISGVVATPLPEGWYTNMTGWGHNDGYWVESVNAYDGKRAVYLQDTIAPLDNYCIGQYLPLGTGVGQVDICSQYKLCFEWASFNRSFPDGRSATSQPVIEYLYYNSSGTPFLPIAPPIVIPETPIANQDWDYLTWKHTEYTFSLPAPPSGAASISIWISDYRPSNGNGILFDNVFLCNAGAAVTGSTITGTQAICAGGNPAAFTQTAAATGTGTLSYQWQSGTTNCTTGFSDIGGATSNTYDVPAGLTQTTYYRVVVSNSNLGVTCTATSNCVTVTVNANPDFSLGLATVCPGANPEVTIGSLTGGTAASSTMKINTGAFVPYVASPPNLTSSNGIVPNTTNTVTVRNEHSCETAKNIAVPDVVPLVCPPVSLTKLPAGSD